ncbi:hypothetical protein CEXT_108581 [Caerostris extrusa]|uniref:Uncharacterized protein n=1 Tax=Caerostris extrusa TaxID=172846 RepID=A0AAV4VP13_CAEEX|nr:hypothetical protein CEXT_108581 [Caerostris extrusa]
MVKVGKYSPRTVSFSYLKASPLDFIKPEPSYPLCSADGWTAFMKKPCLRIIRCFRHLSEQTQLLRNCLFSREFIAPSHPPWKHPQGSRDNRPQRGTNRRFNHDDNGLQAAGLTSMGRSDL